MGNNKPNQTANNNNQQPIISTEPPIGSWASIARIMAEIDPDFDWDAWKDEMKESEGY